jgi:hypothetical protein
MPRLEQYATSGRRLSARDVVNGGLLWSAKLDVSTPGVGYGKCWQSTTRCSTTVGPYVVRKETDCARRRSSTKPPGHG